MTRWQVEAGIEAYAGGLIVRSLSSDFTMRSSPPNCHFVRICSRSLGGVEECCMDHLLKHVLSCHGTQSVDSPCGRQWFAQVFLEACPFFAWQNALCLRAAQPPCYCPSGATNLVELFENLILQLSLLKHIRFALTSWPSFPSSTSH